ncbi:MAG: hypothetical protein ACYC9I_10510 [Desulfuromonadales bacterium]
MRCPKCGFHSFDYLDNCKKCGVDLTEQKLRFKFQGYVAPVPVSGTPEPERPTFEHSNLPAVAEAEDEAIDFGFDVLEQETLPPLPDFTADAIEVEDGFAGFAADDPSAIDLAADSGLSLDQPFSPENENLPDDDLPKLDNRFEF